MKTLIALAMLFLCVGFADAQSYIRSGQLSQSWECSLNGIAATLTECQAVPANSDQRHYITDISVQTTTGTTGTYAIRTGTGTNCGTGTAQLFPSSGSGSDRYNAPINTEAMASIRFTTPLIPAKGHAICMIGFAVQTVSIQMQGFLAP